MASAPRGGTSTITGMLQCHEHFVVTAGSDRNVRFWDLRDPPNSYRITTPQTEQNSYHVRYNARLENATVVFEEIATTDTDIVESKATVEGHGPADAHTTSPASGGTSSPGAAAATAATTAAAASAARNRRHYGPIATLTCHEDDITDLKAIEHPVKMLATASRDGTVRIWV